MSPGLGPGCSRSTSLCPEAARIGHTTVMDKDDLKRARGAWRLRGQARPRGAVEPVIHIPATGDCSYPGLIRDLVQCIFRNDPEPSSG